MARIVTIPEAAEILDCSRQNVYDAINRHNIPTQDRPVQKSYVIRRIMNVKHVDVDLLEQAREGLVRDKAKTQD
jgi:hypothetical protein